MRDCSPYANALTLEARLGVEESWAAIRAQCESCQFGRLSCT